MRMTLRAARINAGLNQEQAAGGIGVSTRTIINWEKGKSFPDAKQITRIESLYNISYADINFFDTNIGLTET